MKLVYKVIYYKALNNFIKVKKQTIKNIISRTTNFKRCFIYKKLDYCARNYFKKTEK